MSEHLPVSQELGHWDMGDHLPECNQRETVWERAHYSGVECICDALRACEQRMLDDDVLAAAYHGQAGYAAGLDAAREALTAVENDPDAEIDYDRDYMADPSGNTRNPRMWLRDALAAIDALKENK